MAKLLFEFPDAIIDSIDGIRNELSEYETNRVMTVIHSSGLAAGEKERAMLLRVKKPVSRSAILREVLELGWEAWKARYPTKEGRTARVRPSSSAPAVYPPVPSFTTPPPPPVAPVPTEPTGNRMCPSCLANGMPTAGCPVCGGYGTY